MISIMGNHHHRQSSKSARLQRSTARNVSSKRLKTLAPFGLNQELNK